MKKIVILGAGIYQVPLIQAAKKMGLYVIVVSIPGDYPGFKMADKVYEINTTDCGAVCEMAEKEGIDAIVTTGTDVAVSTIGYVCERLGLPGICEKSARLATDKACMKEAFLAGGVHTARFERIHDEDEALAAAEKIGYPVMLKIVDKSGSRGITKANHDRELKEAYAYGRQYTAASHMLVEKYIEGNEIGVDAFVQNGQVKLIVPHDKLVYQSGRTGIPMGHICPMKMSDELAAKLEEETRKVIKALELDNCAVNMDVFVTENEEVSVIEAAGRCGATGIPEVISGYVGVNYYDAILKNALGIEVEFPKAYAGNPTASVLLFSNKTGRLQSVSYEAAGRTYRDEDCLDAQGVKVQLDFMQGTMVHAFENGTHRIGQAVFSGKSEQDVLEKIAQFQERLVVDVE